MFNKNSHQPLGIKDKVISTGLLIPKKKITIKIFKKCARKLSYSNECIDSLCPQNSVIRSLCDLQVEVCFFLTLLLASQLVQSYQNLKK